MGPDNPFGRIIGAVGDVNERLFAFLVAERTREIGIHMALCAEASSVLRMIMRHGLS